MIYKFGRTVHHNKTENLFCRTAVLKNPESHVLTDTRFIIYLVSIFSDLIIGRIYKMPYRDSPNQEIEILMCFNYLNLLKPNEYDEDYYIRKPNEENFLLEIEDKKHIYVGENLVSFETKDEIVKCSSEFGFNDNDPFAYGEKTIYFMTHRKFILIQEYETSTEENENQ